MPKTLTTPQDLRTSFTTQPSSNHRATAVGPPRGTTGPPPPTTGTSVQSRTNSGLGAVRPLTPTTGCVRLKPGIRHFGGQSRPCRPSAPARLFARATTAGPEPHGRDSSAGTDRPPPRRGHIRTPRRHAGAQETIRYLRNGQTNKNVRPAFRSCHTGSIVNTVMYRMTSHPHRSVGKRLQGRARDRDVPARGAVGGCRARWPQGAPGRAARSAGVCCGRPVLPAHPACTGLFRVVRG